MGSDIVRVLEPLAFYRDCPSADRPSKSRFEGQTVEAGQIHTHNVRDTLAPAQLRTSVAKRLGSGLSC